MQTDCGSAEVWRGAIFGQACLQNQGLIYQLVCLYLMLLCVNHQPSSSQWYLDMFFERELKLM